VGGKALAARFDGEALTSDAGLLALREVERRLDVAARLLAASTIVIRRALHRVGSAAACYGRWPICRRASCTG
jgi:hypothetical protein